MNAGTVATDVAEVQGVADAILKTIEAVDPEVEVPAEIADGLVILAGQMVTKALTALQNASGVPITTESITALLPDSTPLPLPPE